MWLLQKSFKGGASTAWLVLNNKKIAQCSGDFFIVRFNVSPIVNFFCLWD